MLSASENYSNKERLTSADELLLVVLDLFLQHLNLGVAWLEAKRAHDQLRKSVLDDNSVTHLQIGDLKEVGAFGIAGSEGCLHFAAAQRRRRRQPRRRRHTSAFYNLVASRFPKTFLGSPARGLHKSLVATRNLYFFYHNGSLKQQCYEQFSE